MGKSKVVSPDSVSAVKSAIDSIVEGKISAKDAISSLVGMSESSAAPTKPESVDLNEGEEIVCPNCGSHNMEEGFVESEDGTRLQAYRCKDCDTGLVESINLSGESADPELVEAEIDENDPSCPACGSHDLSAEMLESEDGEEHMMISCGHCHAQMIVAD